jgi:hypothetical protein
MYSYQTSKATTIDKNSITDRKVSVVYKMVGRQFFCLFA